MLILGIGVFVASFVLPEKKEKLKEEDRRLGEAEIKKMVDASLEEVKTKVADTADETISDIMEKTERSLERITNEKIMAVNEYSDTVLEAIHKNHDEAVFLYDMLNDKHDKLKNTATEVEKKTKETLEKVKEAEKAAEKEVEKAAEKAAEKVAEKAALQISQTPVPKQAPVLPVQTVPTSLHLKQPEQIPSRQTAIAVLTQPETLLTKQPMPEEEIRKALGREAGKELEKELGKEEGQKKTVKKAVVESPVIEKTNIENPAIENADIENPTKMILEKAKRPEKSIHVPKMDLSFASVGEEGKNNNEIILELHKAGKSNVAIAKELGLGIGEVKLVIDLFKGV